MKEKWDGKDEKSTGGIPLKTSLPFSPHIYMDMNKFAYAQRWKNRQYLVREFRRSLFFPLDTTQKFAWFHFVSGVTEYTHCFLLVCMICFSVVLYL